MGNSYSSGGYCGNRNNIFIKCTRDYSWPEEGAAHLAAKALGFGGAERRRGGEDQV